MCRIKLSIAFCVLILISGCGYRLSENDLKALLRETGFPEHAIPTMICIANEESGRFVYATQENRPFGSRPASTDIGLFQINDYYWTKPVPEGCGVDREALFDQKVNAKCALYIYKIRKGFTPWEGYKRNRTKCDNYPA